MAKDEKPTTATGPTGDAPDSTVKPDPEKSDADLAPEPPQELEEDQTVESAVGEPLENKAKFDFDTGPTASGNQYPQSYRSAANEANEAMNNANRLRDEAIAEYQRAQALGRKAQGLQGDDDELLSFEVEPEDEG